VPARRPFIAGLYFAVLLGTNFYICREAFIAESTGHFSSIHGQRCGLAPAAWSLPIHAKRNLRASPIRSKNPASIMKLVPGSGASNARPWGRLRPLITGVNAPAKGENLGCFSGSGTCSRNVIEFRNYRKFEAESKVKFGQ
jgi:hypothetical protein